MTLIRKVNELEIPRNVKMMIYGQAGAGKTTLALSASKPCVLDFDRGVRRVSPKHLMASGAGVIQVNRWEEVMSILTAEVDDIMPYDTIVVDTVGKMMDYITSYRCNGGQPRLQDWGRINNDFKWFCSRLSELGKNIIFVAHRNGETKKGESVSYVPQLRTKNYNDIITELDLLGYIEMKNENGRQLRTITFDPREENDGKNTCGLPSLLHIPDLSSSANTFVEDVIFKAFRNRLDEWEQIARSGDTDEVKAFASQIDAITDAEGATAFYKAFIAEQHAGDVKRRVGALLKKKTDALGLKLDKATQAYV